MESENAEERKKRLRKEKNRIHYLKKVNVEHKEVKPQNKEQDDAMKEEEEHKLNELQAEAELSTQDDQQNSKITDDIKLELYTYINNVNKARRWNREEREELEQIVLEIMDKSFKIGGVRRVHGI